MSIMDSLGCIGDFAVRAALISAWARSLEDDCLKNVCHKFESRGWIDLQYNAQINR